MARPRAANGRRLRHSHIGFALMMGIAMQPAPCEAGVVVLVLPPLRTSDARAR
jgi:hypothetical protein